MKSLFFAFAVAAATLMSGISAQAGTITGGISFFATTQNNSSGNILDTRAITGVSSTTASGDFSSTPVLTQWGNFTISNPMGSPLTITSAFGTFVGTLTSDNGAAGVDGSGNGSRTMNFAGAFTAGNAYTGKQDPTTANLSIVLNQSTTTVESVTTVSFSTTLNLTTAGVPAPAVPEPTSMAIFGLGALGIAARRFRRK